MPDLLEENLEQIAKSLTPKETLEFSLANKEIYQKLLLIILNTNFIQIFINLTIKWLMVDTYLNYFKINLSKAISLKLYSSDYFKF